MFKSGCDSKNLVYKANNNKKSKMFHIRKHIKKKAMVLQGKKKNMVQT